MSSAPRSASRAVTFQRWESPRMATAHSVIRGRRVEGKLPHRGASVARWIEAENRRSLEVESESVVFGVMLEGNLVEGRQLLCSRQVYPPIVTAPCLRIDHPAPFIPIFAETFPRQ